MGAISAVVLGLCSQGDHIVAQRQLFGGTAMLFSTVCPRFGIDVTLVDAAEPGAFADAVRPGKTMLVFAESPSNPQLALADLEELGAIAGPDDRGRFDVRDAARSATAAATASIWWCTRPRRRWPATTTPCSAWWPGPRI